MIIPVSKNLRGLGLFSVVFFMLSLISNGWFSYIFLLPLIVGSFFLSLPVGFLQSPIGYAFLLQVLWLLLLETMEGSQPRITWSHSGSWFHAGVKFSFPAFWFPNGILKADCFSGIQLCICLKTILVFLTCSSLITSYLSFCSRFVTVFSGGGGWVLGGLETSLL